MYSAAVTVYMCCLLAVEVQPFIWVEMAVACYYMP